jgi:hypothetical protein
MPRTGSSGSVTITEKSLLDVVTLSPTLIVTTYGATLPCVASGAQLTSPTLLTVMPAGVLNSVN